MAATVGIGFLLSIFGDGVAKSITVNLTTAPILLQMASFGGGAQTVAGFGIASSFPVAVTGIASEDFQVPTATLDSLLKTMTLTWPKALPQGQKVDITGYLQF